MSLSPLAGAIAHMPMAIGKWHYRKGHKGCKPGGRRPVPEVDPALVRYSATSEFNSDVWRAIQLEPVDTDATPWHTSSLF